jgi:hypothetical protein
MKNSAHLFICLVTIFAGQDAMAANSNSTTKQAIADYIRPLSFEPNRGQTDKQVDFLAQGTGYSLFLSHAEAVMVLRRGDPPRAPGSHSRPMAVKWVTVRMRPVGGNASAEVDALGKLAGKSNYFIGSLPDRWRTGIPNYAKVRYGNVYPGVDMIYYGNQRQLEYDFVVGPGADPGSIALEFQSASKAELDREGGLVMHTDAGDLRWHKPVAYQEVNGTRKLVACAYAPRDRQRLGFALGAYDSTQPLIIDPELEYSSVLGGIVRDEGHAIAVDVHGNAYITGSANSFGNSDTPFPTTEDAFQKQPKGLARSAFVAKFNSNGKLIYSTYLGGSGFDTCPPNGCYNGDEGNGIAVDKYGNAYVTGDTASPDFPVKNAFQPTLKSSNGLSNAFVTKLDRGGDALVYSTYLGGSVADAGSGIAVDTEGNAYVTGGTGSDDFPTKNPLPNQPQNTGSNAFVTKLCPAGNSLVYSTYLGGSMGDGGSGIAVDRRGHAYVTGATNSPDFPTKNAFQQELKSEFTNAFVTKFDTGGDSLIYSTYLGGSGDGEGFGDVGAGIAVDVHGNAYITGSTASPDFPTKNAFQPSLTVTGDLSPTAAFVTKLDNDGRTLVYSTYLSGSGYPPFAPGDAGFGIAVDKRGSAYVTGAATSPDFPTKNAFQPVIADLGGGNAFVTKFDPAGTALVYSSFLGGSRGFGDRANGIGVDAQGNAYLTGRVGTGDFPIKNSIQNPPGGVFVAKISAR